MVLNHVLNVLYYFFAFIYIGTALKPASALAKHYHAITHASSAPTDIKPQKSPRTHLYMSQNGHHVL